MNEVSVEHEASRGDENAKPEDVETRWRFTFFVRGAVLGAQVDAPDPEAAARTLRACLDGWPDGYDIPTDFAEGVNRLTVFFDEAEVDAAAVADIEDLEGDP